MSNLLNDLLKAVQQKGVSGTGSLIGQLARLRKENDGRGLALEPGDFVKSMAGKGKPLAISAPLAYDLWYLHNHVSLFTWVKEDESVEDYINNRLSFIKEKLKSGASVIYPLRGLTNPQQLDVDTSFSLDAMRNTSEVKNKAEYFVQLMAFEIKPKDLALRWDTDRTYYKTSYKTIDFHGAPLPVPVAVKTDMGLKDIVGYLTFPVGQIGVMEQISFFQESWSDEPNDNDQYRPNGEEKVFNPQPTELFPPKESFETHCYGDYLIEGWTKSEAYAAQLEVGCKGIPAGFYGDKDVKPKGWMRLWILEEDVFPVPGEFIGILCKPYPVPVHCWWYQESNPFLYAGNWIDTENLSSGIVQSVTLEANRPAGSVGDEYVILYHGIPITVHTSDFYQYTVGERVAVLKLGSTATKAEKAFNFTDQKNYGEPEKGSTSTDYVIVPLTYYKEKEAA